MKLIITDNALRKLKEHHFYSEKNCLFIEYETDGCGCVVSGVSKLKEIPRSSVTDDLSFIDAEPAYIQVVIQSRTEWVYEENMSLDYSETASIFQLKSPNQMLNPRMKYESVDKF